MAKEVHLIWENFVRDPDKGFKALYDLYFERIFAYCLGKVKNIENAENITADTFIRILNFKEYGEVDQPENWIFTIARNLCLTFLSKQSRRSRILDNIYSESGTDSIDLLNIDLEVINELISKKLKDKDYQIWKLHEEGFSNSEIAEKMGMATKTVANRKAMVLSEIRQILKPYLDTIKENKRPDASI